MRVSGGASNLHANLVSGSFVPLAELPLTAGEDEGVYLSSFTAGAAAFRVVVTGTDLNGYSIQRMSAPLLTPVAAAGDR
jgi:hypothetical protein